MAINRDFISRESISTSRGTVTKTKQKVLVDDLTAGRKLIDKSQYSSALDAQATVSNNPLPNTGGVLPEGIKNPASSPGQTALGGNAITGHPPESGKKGSAVAPSAGCMSSALPSGDVGETNIQSLESSSYVTQSQSGATRSLPLSAQLLGALNAGLKTANNALVDSSDAKAAATAGESPPIVLTLNVVSGGQPNKGSGGDRTGSIRHDINSGTAADGDFVYNGRVLDGNNQEDRKILAVAINSLTKAGIRGWGWDSVGYMGSQRFHMDLQGSSPGSPGGGLCFWGAGGTGQEDKNPGFADRGAWVQQAATATSVDDIDQSMLTDAGASNNPAYNRAAANCSNPGGGSGGGCGGLAGGVLGAAASIAAGSGLGIPSSLTSSLSSIANGPIGSLTSELSGAIGSVTNLVDQALDISALTSPLTELTKPLGDIVNNLGGDILPGLSGVIPGEFTDLLDVGSLTDVISGDIGSVLKEGVANFGDFTGIVDSVAGGLGDLDGIIESFDDIPGQIFGDFAGGLGELAENFSGFDLVGDVVDSIEGLEGINILPTGLSDLAGTVNLLGPLNETLDTLVDLPLVDGFKSNFGNFNSFVTQGIGELTGLDGNLKDLARDFQDLGNFGDFEDIFHLGSPKQVVRQLFENNALDNLTNLPEFIAENNINISDFANTLDDDKILQKLSSLTDKRIIDNVKIRMGMSPELELESLADLTRPEKILKRSANTKKFTEFKDMAPLFTVCSAGAGNIKTFHDLGVVLDRIETVEDFDALNQEPALIRPTEVAALKELLPIKNSFNRKKPTMADFIGSTAGYVHEDVLPLLRKKQDSFANSPILSTYKQLRKLVVDLINGNYIETITETDAGVFVQRGSFEPAAGDPYPSNYQEVQVHWVGDVNIGSYQFNEDYYKILNNVVEIAADFVETELTNIKELQTFNNDDEKRDYYNIIEAETLHRASAEQLYNEKSMRKTAGVEFGKREQEERFIGTGTRTEFPLATRYTKSGNKSSVDLTIFAVYVDGIFQSNYNFDQSSNNLVFNSAPAPGSKIIVKYNKDVIEHNTKPKDAFAFAKNLENLATQTGYGQPAEFLSRLAKNDYEGQRIQSVMIQARNNQRLSQVGIDCNGFNRVNPDHEEGKLFNFVEKTGIWSKDPARAGEILLQQKQGVNNYQQFAKKRVEEKSFTTAQTIENTLTKIMPALFLIQNEQVLITPTLADLYFKKRNSVYNEYESLDDYHISFTINVSRENFSLGNYKQILSEFVRLEDLESSVFVEPLTTESEDYLDSIEINLRTLISIVQKALLVNAGRILGLSYYDVFDVFGSSSVTKLLLNFYANNISSNTG